MTATDHHNLEREIRVALHAAADQIAVESAQPIDAGPDGRWTDQPFVSSRSDSTADDGNGGANRNGLPVSGAHTRERNRPGPGAPPQQQPGHGQRSAKQRGSRRWVLPAVAAAAVLAVVAMAFIATKDRVSQRDMTLATTLVQDGNTADLGGIRFPVPHGWTAQITDNTPAYVRVCIAQSPSADCDGVTLTAALPGGPPLDHTEPLSCINGNPFLVMADRGDTLADRPAHHYYGWCGADGGPVAHQWILLDQGLDIRTPMGQYEDQAYQIADGLDLSHWIRSPGEQRIFSTMATQSGGVDPQISETNGSYSIFGARFPVPNGWESLLTGSDLDFKQVCLARTPTPDCHGVTVRLSLPDGPLVDTVPALDCPTTPEVVLNKDISTLGGRPGEHLTLRCAATGERRQVWQLTDGSLQVWADAEFEQQGALVVKGLELDDWQRPPADPAAESTAESTTSTNVPAGTSAPASSESGDLTRDPSPATTVTSTIPAAQPTVP